MALKRLKLDPSVVRAYFKSKLPDVHWSDRQGTARCPFILTTKPHFRSTQRRVCTFVTPVEQKAISNNSNESFPVVQAKRLKTELPSLLTVVVGRTYDRGLSPSIHTKMKTGNCAFNKFGSSRRISDSADQMGRVAGFGICKACR